MKWSKNDSLAMEDIRLRFKDWVELIPLGPGHEDINAISSKFFLPKGKSKTIQFHPNKVLELYLELIYDKYAEVQDRLDDLENQPVCSSITCIYYFNIIHIEQHTRTEDVNIVHYRNSG
jgi:hypothetical protein